MRYFMFFFIAISLHLNAETGSRDSPIVIECNTCYSNSDYESSVRRLLKPHDAKYFAVINTKSQQMRTYYGYDITEKELGFYSKEVYSISNLAAHEEQFRDHLAWVASAAPAKTATLNYPNASSGGSCCYSPDLNADYTTWAKSQLLKRDFLYAKKIYVVTIKFENGYNVILELTPMSSSSIVIAVVAPDGSIIQSSSSSGGTSSGSAGSSAVKTIYIPSNNVGGDKLMCSFEGTTLTCKWV